MQKEIEATYANIDKDAIRAKLKETGFELRTPEYLMQRKTFDFSKVAPGENKWGRVRKEADKITMAIKHIKGEGIHDMYELEMVVDDFDKASEMFEQCNIPTKAYQENYREVWARDAVEVSIDTWPGLEPFLEIEGPSKEIVQSFSSQLGFEFEDAIFGSIDIVYEKMLGISAEKIIKLPEITFKNPPTEA